MKLSNKFVAALLFLSAVPVVIAAQSTPDVSVSDARFTYDVQQGAGPINFSPGRRASPLTTATDSPVQQVSAIFRNAGAKSIKSISWEYIVFKDADEREVLKVYRVRSHRTILPGASVRLAKEGYHLKHSPYEKARVTRIDYADGTMWQGARTKR